MVEVEEGGLSAFEQDVRVRRKRIVEQADRVRQVRHQARAQRAESFHHLVDVEFFAAGFADQLVLDRCALADQPRKPFGVTRIASADTDPAHLVGVSGTDATQRRTELVVTTHCLGDRIVALVPREDEVRSTRHLEVRTRVATRFEHVDFVEQRRQVNNDSVGDHRNDVRVQNSRRHELQRILLAIDDHGMARVVAALIAHDVGVLFRQQVDDLGFAFVAPLGSDNDSDWHDAPRPGFTRQKWLMERDVTLLAAWACQAIRCADEPCFSSSAPIPGYTSRASVITSTSAGPL